MEKMNFIVSYSGGKDASLALYRCLEKGNKPVSLLTTYNKNEKRSWFHGIPKEILMEVSKSIGIPIKLIPTGFSKQYAIDFEKGLMELKNKGADSCVFGDIDIEEHYNWCDKRCENIGIKSIFPLWNENRKNLVHESIDKGFKAVITTINNKKLSEKYLGKTLTKELVLEIEKDGADPCGENGEYHTFVYDGPNFKYTIDLKFGNIIRMENYSSIEIKI